MTKRKGQGLAIALRRKMTDAEQRLWRRIRDRQLASAKFKRQHPLCGYIVDFVALDLKLVIEIDGGQHAINAAKDLARTRILEESGYHVVRFWNHDVLGNIDGVLSAILQELDISR